VQLRWVAPTALFFEFGAEAANGGKFPGPSARPTAPACGRPSPTWAATSATRRPGGWACPTCAPSRGSGLRGRRRGGQHTFSGRSQTWIADFVYKWAPNGNASERYLKLQGEYLWRRETAN
jgi:hypothetical protein